MGGTEESGARHSTATTFAIAPSTRTGQGRTPQGPLSRSPPHFASLLLQQGESPTYVKEQMGHSSIQVTVDIFGHLIPGANRQAVDRLDDTTIRNPGATDKEQGLRREP